MIQTAMQTGLSGMQHSYRNMTEAAHRLVNTGLNENPAAGKTGPADFATPMVEMMAAEHVFTASAKVVSTTDRALGTLLDTTA